MTAALAAACAVLGLGVGVLLNRWAAGLWARRDTPRSEPGTAGDRAVRPPYVELGTAALFGLTALWTGPRSDLPAFLVLAAAAVVLTVIDLQHHLLPNLVIVPAAVLGLVFLLVSALFDGTAGALVRAVLAAVVVLAGFLVLALVSPSGLGMGDVKLAGLLGLYLGWVSWGVVVLAVLAAFLVQALLALTLLVSRRVTRQSELPFGPALLVGTALALAAGKVLFSGG